MSGLRRVRIIGIAAIDSGHVLMKRVIGTRFLSLDNSGLVARA